MTDSAGVTVTVDSLACEGTAFCVRSLPDVFSLSDDGVATVNEDGVHQAGLSELQEIESMCPTTAIQVSGG